jgi:hypothetical protein
MALTEKSQRARGRGSFHIEFPVEVEALVPYPAPTVTEYQDMSDLPAEELSQKCIRLEDAVNEDKRRGVSAASATQALKAPKM